MYAYSIVQIKDILCRNILNTAKREEYSAFFNAENLIDNLGVRTFYNHDKQPSILIGQEDIAKVCLLASSRFGRDIKYKELLPNIKRLVELPINEKGVQRHDVSCFKDAIPIITAHRKNSSYYKAIDEKEKIKKEQNLLSYKLYEEDRKRKAELFKRRGNMDKDFSSKKIVSIDFEFNPKKKGFEAITEFGISIYKDGNIENYHYLIEENYRSKANRQLQHQFSFGKTEYIFIKDVANKMNSIFENTDYFLFHELNSDNKLLQEIGINLEERKNSDLLDTQIFFQTHFRDKDRETNGLTLKGLLDTFEIDNQHLHNSGNDAAYTLMLFNKMVDEYNEKNRPINEIKKNTPKLKM